VSNAIKFSPPGGKVTIHLEGNEAGAVLAVEDTGIGISSDKLPRVFDRFYQVDGSATRKYGGMGLGLAICREIVEAHGGIIEAQSEVGKGSVFTVKLPVTNLVM
jgi:signal transduction histidine kinase